MLDDLKIIHQRDSEDALGVSKKQWLQYKHNFNFTWAPSGQINNFLIGGMGGSGLAAKTLRSWPGLSLPFEVVQDYLVPKYVNEKSLLVLSSYSGNTEEELSMYDHASSLKSRPMMIIVSSGGELLKRAMRDGLPYIKLPTGYQPRMTFGYQLRALAEILEQAKLGTGLIDELDNSAEKLQAELELFSETRSTDSNLAKQIALEMVGKSVVVYASNLFLPVAYKWKISINENAKTVSWYNVFPEFDHNEFLGWTSHPIDKPYSVINIKSSLDEPKINERFTLSERLLSGNKPAAETISLKGATLLGQIMYGIALGDFVSIYLAILNGIDPTPVKIIEELKKELK